MAYSIYVADDEKNIRELLKNFLQSDGYEVSTYDTGDLLLAAFEREPADLVILDIMMPGRDGIECVKELRKYSDVPIILLTAKDGELEYVNGITLGSDDYLTKPFSVLELISRVRAILRRCTVEEKPETVELGGIVLDDSKHIVTSNGEQCSLTYKEYELLKYLLNNKGMALTRENIIINVWGYDFEGESRTVDMHITTLRQKLGECGNLIKTVRNVGYKAGE